ncbi:MAG: serine hydrolase [Alphaproteobacteria bacterium]
MLSLFLGVLTSAAQADDRYASIVVDAKSGKVVQSYNSESLRHPASLTKMMTLYMTFKALKQGKLRGNEGLRVSSYAAAQSPSKLGLKPGGVLRVRDAILALIVQSANDAAVTLGEEIGGSEENFARMMTQQAKELGMTRTVFYNASGLPDDRQVTTARDMAILARALLFNFPEHYRLFSTRDFKYRGVLHANHNHLMSRYPGMDGIKTGYIRASGFNLVASAVRGKTRLIGVIFGGETARGRDNDMAALLNDSFAKSAALLTSQAATPVPAVKVADAAAAQAAFAAAPAAAAPYGAGDTVEDVITENNKTEPTPVAISTQPSPPSSQPVLQPEKSSAESAAPRAQSWAIQIGAFRNRAAAEKAVGRIGQYLPKDLASARYQVVRVAAKSGTVYRSRLIDLDESAARAICRMRHSAARSVPLFRLQNSINEYVGC